MNESEAIEKIYRNIGEISGFDRIPCSTDYDLALAFLQEQLEDLKHLVLIDEFPRNASVCGWQLPQQINHWRDGRSDPYVTIPDNRSIKVLSVFIKGKSKKTILFVSHLCHPAPGANDNASGPAMMLELIQYYNSVENNYSFLFLFTVEYWGTILYINQYKQKIKDIVCGISLDMMGGDQYLCQSSMIVDEIPHHHSTIPNVDLLFWYYLRHYSREGKYRAIGNKVMAFRCDFQYYLGGSDHYILNDSTVGIPSTCLNTYPDVFYHSKEDTIDKISKKTIALFYRTIISGLAHFQSKAKNDTLFQYHLIVQNYRERLLSMISSEITQGTESKAIDLLVSHFNNVLLKRFNSIVWASRTMRDSFKALLRKEIRHGKSTVGFSGVVKRKRRNKVIKNFFGPLSRDFLFKTISSQDAVIFQAYKADDQLFFQKLDAALNFLKDKDEREAAELVRYYYGGGDFYSILVNVVDILKKYKFIT